jgi:hypothetical protein
MAKNKSTKRAPKQKASKRAAAKTATPDVEFLQTPARFVAKLDKEIVAQQKSEAKLKAAINKTSVQAKKAEAKVKALTRSAAAKKQLSDAKKFFSALVSQLDALIKQHDAAVKTLTSLSEQKAKFIALGKYLAQFEKDWAKKSKQKKVKAKAKPRAQKKPVQALTELDNIKPLSVEQTDANANDIETNEPTEIAA